MRNALERLAFHCETSVKTDKVKTTGWAPGRRSPARSRALRPLLERLAWQVRNLDELFLPVLVRPELVEALQPDPFVFFQTGAEVGALHQLKLLRCQFSDRRLPSRSQGGAVGVELAVD